MLFKDIKKVIDYGEYRVSIKDDATNNMLDLADSDTKLDNYEVYKIEGGLDQDNDCIVHIIVNAKPKPNSTKHYGVVMREILFRGYNKIQNNWYYGMLDKFDNKYFINDGSGTKTFVEEDSIGQYTGVKDENDKEIYEGDILNWDVDAYGYVKMINGSWRICPAFLIVKEYYIGELAEKAKVIGNIYEETKKNKN